MYEWHVAGKTDVGRVRELNEDCIHTNKELGFTILADGMGGHQGGEIASAMAVTGITEELEDATASLDANSSNAICDLLDTSISKVNAEIFATAESNAHYKGMGTTVVVSLYHHDKLYFAHVGDSRLYRLRQGQLEQLTSDHSLVNELLEQGFYKSKAEADSAGQKNVITRAVGIADSVQVSTGVSDVREGDIFLLCSDGLSDMISDDSITESLLAHQDLEQVIDELIEKACEAGGRDNISVILLQANKGSLLKKSLGWLFKS